MGLAPYDAAHTVLRPYVGIGLVRVVTHRHTLGRTNEAAPCSNIQKENSS